MTGGFSTPKKGKGLKVSDGQPVKVGQLLSRGINVYKSGKNVKGLSDMVALCAGKVYFSHKKTSHGKFRTFINVAPDTKAAKK
jgi:ribosomal protein L27